MCDEREFFDAINERNGEPLTEAQKDEREFFDSMESDDDE